jgi:hypothetical protein
MLIDILADGTNSGPAGPSSQMAYQKGKAMGFPDPEHTVESVARQLVEGLENGGLFLREADRARVGENTALSAAGEGANFGKAGECSMSETRTILEINRELAAKINEEARRDPQSPYAGKFVGIANGQVVVVSDDFDQLARRLREIEPDPSKRFIVEASRDYTEVVEIWELR